ASDLVSLPNFNAAMRLMIGGLPSQPFTIRGLPPLGNINPEMGLAIKQLSAAKFGVAKNVVEADIAARLSGRPIPAPTPQPIVAPAPVATPAVAPAPAPVTPVPALATAAIAPQPAPVVAQAV